MDKTKASFREELKQTQKYLQLIGQAIANLNPDHKCLSRKDIWKFMLDYYGAEQTNEKIEYRDFLIQIRKLTGEQKLINNDGYYSLDQWVYKELTDDLKKQGYLNKPIPEYQRAPSTVDRQTQINENGTGSQNHKRSTSKDHKQVFENGRKSANKSGNTTSVSRDQYTAKNASRRNGHAQDNETQHGRGHQKINSFIKLGFDQKKIGTPKDLMQGLDPRSKYTPIQDVEKKVVSTQEDQQVVNEQKQDQQQPKKANKGFGFITPAPIEKTANSGKQSAVAPGLSNSARRNRQELAEIHREAAQPEHQTEVYRAPATTSTRKNAANQYNKRQKDHGKQKLQKMRSAQHKHTISKMSKRIKKTKKTTNNTSTTAHTVSYTQPTERLNTRSSAGQSQRNSSSKLSPKKIGRGGQTHPTTQHKRDYQAAKVKVHAKLNTRAGSQKVSSRSSVRKIAPQASQKSSARVTPNIKKQQQVSSSPQTRKQSSILKKSKAITKKKTTKSRSIIKKSKSLQSHKSSQSSIKVNLFGTKKVTLRSSPAKKVKRSKASSSKARRSNSVDPASKQSRISIHDNKMSIRKANEASPAKQSRSSSASNMCRRRIQPIRKNKAPRVGDREAKVKAARTMHQMYLNMGPKNKSAIKLVKDKKMHA